MDTFEIRRFESANARIYRVPIPLFPTFFGNIYFIIIDQYIALIDTGSGIGDSAKHVLNSIDRIREQFGETFDWGDLSRIIITHGHIDHYGGLGTVRERSNAPIAVHELDRRVLINHSERLALTNQAVSAFLWHAGLNEEEHEHTMELYSWSKGLFRSVEVETILRDGDLLDNIFRVHHVPGHCPGQICLQFDDILMSADHVLARITPHMAPESIMPSTGLDHYLNSLHKVAKLPNIRLALGGHEQEIENYYERIEAIEASHKRKLDRILEACSEPRTIKELADTIYNKVDGYHTLLALEEIAAHIEYLDQRGALAIDNLDQVAGGDKAAPRYRQS